MGKIFNVDLNYATRYEGIEANTEEEAIEIALEWWSECIPNHKIEYVSEMVKRYTHPFNDEEFDTFEGAERDLLTNHKEELHIHGWYWEAFKDMAEERDLDIGTLYDLIYGSNGYRDNSFRRWEEILDTKVGEIAIEEIEVEI